MKLAFSLFLLCSRDEEEEEVEKDVEKEEVCVWGGQRYESRGPESFIERR